MALERNVKKTKRAARTHDRRNVWLLVLTTLLVVVSLILFIPPQDKITLGLDIRGGLSVVLTADEENGVTPTSEQMEDSRTIIENRVNALGASESTVQVQGTDQILVQIPGLEDSEDALKTIGSTGQLIFASIDTFTDDEIVEKIQSGSYGENTTIEDEFGNAFPAEEDAELEVPPGTYDVLLTGDNIESISVDRASETSAYYAVNLELDPEGTQAFADATRNLVAMKGQIVILLDDKVESAPAVQSIITDGRVAITGNYSADEAKAFQTVLESGSLPVNFDFSQSQVVGPTLGIDALFAGLVVVLIGLALVMLYLLFFYKGLGIITASAVLVMAVMYLGILAALSAFGLFSLTLAGVAGIVLTIGMAADSSILVVERFREEIRMGKSVRAASQSGVRHAIFTSIDADLVTLVSALCLFFLASASVKGFGLTLSLGIFCDIIMMLVFKAPLIRLLAPKVIARHPGFWGIKDCEDAAHYYSDLAEAEHVPIAEAETGDQMNAAETAVLAEEADGSEGRSIAIEAAKKIKGRFIKHDINFLGYRRIFLTVAACAMVACFAVMGFRGFNFGIEFTSGTSITYANTGDLTSDELRSAFEEQGFDEVTIQTTVTNGDPGFLVRSTETDTETANAIASAVGDQFGIAPTDTSVDTIDPSWGQSVIQSSIIAFLVSMLLIIIYIAIRFEFKMGVIAVVALLHDLILVMGIYALVGREVNPNTIAALLTILGYSLYDTVVVFHRINDNMSGENIRCTFMTMANHSMNQVLIRTINTTATSFVPVFCMLLFGGETLKDFAFAMSIGLIAGSYSSIAVAVPLFSIWKTREPRYAKLAKKYGSQIGLFTFESADSGPIEQVPVARIEAARKERERAQRRAERAGATKTSADVALADEALGAREASMAEAIDGRTPSSQVTSAQKAAKNAGAGASAGASASKQPQTSRAAAKSHSKSGKPARTIKRPVKKNKK